MTEHNILVVFLQLLLKSKVIGVSYLKLIYRKILSK